MNLTEIAPHFYVSPQIDVADLALLSEAGIRTVVNNRPDGEEEGQPQSSCLRQEALHLGLRYVDIPVVPGHMTDDDALALRKAIVEADGPILAFCRSGARSTNLWKRSRELAAQAP